MGHYTTPGDESFEPFGYRHEPVAQRAIPARNPLIGLSVSVELISVSDRITERERSSKAPPPGSTHRTWELRIFCGDLASITYHVWAVRGPGQPGSRWLGIYPARSIPGSGRGHYSHLPHLYGAERDIVTAANFDDAAAVLAAAQKCVLARSRK